jgi:hypothetical protein
MSDTDHEAIPVTKKEYFSGSKISSSKVVSIKSADSSRRRAVDNLTKVTSWVVILAIIALIIPFLSKGRTVSTIHYPAAVTTASKDYDWTFDNANYAWHVEVPSALLEWDRQMHNAVVSYYANHNGYAQEAMAVSMPANVMDLVKNYSSSASDNGVAWVDEQQNYTFIGSLADALDTLAKKEHFTDEQKIEFLQSFVGGAIPYVAKASYQLPAQTLVDGGNCDAKSVLLAAILKRLGYKVALLEYRDQDHMAIGVSASLTGFHDYAPVSFSKDDLSYYFLETTEPDWKLGQLSSATLTDPVINPVD